MEQTQPVKVRNRGCTVNYKKTLELFFIPFTIIPLTATTYFIYLLFCVCIKKTIILILLLTIGMINSSGVR